MRNPARRRRSSPYRLGSPQQQPSRAELPLERPATASPTACSVGVEISGRLTHTRTRRSSVVRLRLVFGELGGESGLSDVRALAIPRVDQDARGIHLAWSGPDLVPLALGGYEIRRRTFERTKIARACVELDAAQLAALEHVGLRADVLGTILCRAGAWPQGTINVPAPVLVFTQELETPTDRVTVACGSKVAYAVALSAGKGAALQPVPPTVPVALSGMSIDTVVVYAVAPSSLQICADVPADPAGDEHEWEQAEVIASGLTLPLHEADASLATRQDELARARSRLLPGETLTDAEADSIAEALRAAAGRADLGRPCDRVMLTRTDAGDPFQETLFSSRIALLTLDPRLRRVLGFGFADQKAVEGQAYEYRVSGSFGAADLDDAVYDVHEIPSGTTLPMGVRIGQVALSFPAPATVVLDPAPDPGALTAVSRRAIALQSVTEPLGFLGGDLLADLACVIDLPRPCSAVTLEVAAGHHLRFGGGQQGDPLAPVVEPLPPGPSAALTFATPVTQLRLAGDGALYAIRIPAGTSGTTMLARTCGPVELAAQPLPDAPAALAAVNLQTPPALITGEIGEQSQVPARPQPGFTLSWAPSTLSPPGIWPADVAAGPPLDAVAHQIEHERVDAGPGTWGPIHAGDNLTFASWPAAPRPALTYGVDLEEAFPFRQGRDPGSPLLLSITDVFGVSDPETGDSRPPEPLGSLHKYRIRAVDIVGRTSGTWTESNQARLEKHIPPPLPVGPQPPPLPVDGRLTGPVGVRARAILASDPDLTAADRVLLAGHAAAVVIEWGWRQLERELDPATAEFRVYLQERPPIEVPGTITSVSSIPGCWTVAYATDRVLVADECKGQWLASNGTAFQILGHTAGSSIQLTLAADAVSPATAPQTGSAVFGRPLAPDHQRPRGWPSRVAVVALGGADTYRHVIFDAVAVDVTKPRQTVWVGVSAADAEAYVADERPPNVPNGGRAGNESSIVSVAVSAVFRGRPAFEVPPPLGDVPEVVTDEPTARQVGVRLDASALLGGTLAGGSSVALDRCSAAAILAVTRVDAAGTVTMNRQDGTAQTVVFPNPGDEAAVVAVLGSDRPESLASRYLLFLLGHFDRPDELLKRTRLELLPADALTDTADPSPARYFYRVRLAAANGAVSVGGAILPVVVRVPSIAPSSAPRRVAVAVGADLAVTVDVDADPELRWVLLFHHVAPWSSSPPDGSTAQLVRIPNRRDLYPANGIRLRLESGELLEPIVKPLADPDVAVQADGSLRLTLDVSLPPPGVVPGTAQYWCYGLSRDGIPSRALGPQSIGLPRQP